MLRKSSINLIEMWNVSIVSLKSPNIKSCLSSEYTQLFSWVKKFLFEYRKSVFGKNPPHAYYVQILKIKYIRVHTHSLLLYITIVTHFVFLLLWLVL